MFPCVHFLRPTFLLFTLAWLLCAWATAEERSMDVIRSYEKNPAYWQYKGRPVLLIGGSAEDNEFQIEGLREELDLLRSLGGNYVRNTMSSRDPGNVWPFARDKQTGKYDLDRWSDEYWQRFERFLKLTGERDIIVQIEVFDRFDFAREPWTQNPFNPRNNTNYTAEQSRLKEAIDTHPSRRESAFFRSLPGRENIPVVLQYQRAFVDRMLASSLKYGHVLYCISNETNEPPDWGAYWADHIHRRAREAGMTVQVTEMWDAHNILDATHEATWKDPGRYGFADISQNNHQKGEAHWRNAHAFLKQIRESGKLRPVNAVKTYGADTGRYGNDQDGTERFWRHLIGGLASVRFHRPPSGLGLTPKAQAHVKSARMLADRFDFFSATPDVGHTLLLERQVNEAYCTRVEGKQYAVYFPNGGAVRLDLQKTPSRFELRWLDIATASWQEPMPIRGGAAVELKSPGRGQFVALLGAVSEKGP